MDINALWQAILEQDAERLRAIFREDAYINWHCTNEHFTVEEYIRANCDYPGKWRGAIERVEAIGDLTILVGSIRAEDASASFHVVSFIKIRDGKIASMDEYYGDDGSAPQWRLERKLGTPIR